VPKAWQQQKGDVRYLSDRRRGQSINRISLGRLFAPIASARVCN
jgi:hypothetical protein